MVSIPHTKASLEVVILSGKDLPALDTNGKSDPFVEVVLGKTIQKTKVIKKTLSPTWNETFKFEVASTDQVLTLKAFDWDMLSSNDAMGEVTVDLSKLKDGKNVFDEKISGTKGGSLQFEIIPHGFVFLSTLKSICQVDGRTGAKQEDDSTFQIIQSSRNMMGFLSLTLQTPKYGDIKLSEALSGDFECNDKTTKEVIYRLIIDSDQKTFEFRDEQRRVNWEGKL